MSWESDLLKWENKARAGLQSKTVQTKSCLGVLERAPNAIEWVIGNRFLRLPAVIDKFTRQYQIIRDCFQLMCPICQSVSEPARDCWQKSRMELESQLLLVWREKDQDYVCPKCGNAKLGLIEDGLLEPIDTLIGVAGMRSSKSVLCGIIATVFEHELAVMGDVNKRFDILVGDPLQVSFVASTQTQSKDTIFAKYKALRKESPWIQKYIAWVKEKEKNQIIQSGMRKWEYSEEADGEIKNGLLNVNFKALNSNSSGLAGATRVAAFLDELSRFQLSESKTSADEIVAVMRQGLMTIRGNRDRLKFPHWWGFFAAVSSPISVDDKTMTMVKQKSRGVYTFHYPTWLMNGDLPRSTFDQSYELDPVGAARDFGAQPPLSASPWVDDEARFRQAINFEAAPTVIFDRTEPVDRTNRKYVGAQIVDCKYDPYHVHYIRFDAGASFDTFAGCSAHGEWEEVIDKQGQRSRKFVTVIDWVLGIAPVLGKTQSEKRTVWFDSVVEIMAGLQKLSKIGLVTFDRWNSEKLIQDIRNLGIESENRSVKTLDFMNFLRAAYEGDVRMLPPRPNEPTDPRQKNDAEKAIYELLRLERSTDLTRIYNPKKGQVHGMNSDDLAQVVVGAHMDVQRSIVSSSGPTTSPAEALKREVASSEYNNLEGGGGRIARGRSW